MGDERKKRSKKEIKGGANYVKQNQEMLRAKKIEEKRGKRKESIGAKKN